MTQLPRIMHQVAKTILHRNFFYIHILRVIKRTSNAFLMTLVSRIMQRVAKAIINWFFFLNWKANSFKRNSIAFSMTPLTRIMHRVAKIIFDWIFFKIRTPILSTEILLHFQWPRWQGLCTRLLKQSSTGTFFIFI